MDILHVFDEIYKRRVSYCVICFRSEQDRRMVDKKSLEQFIKSINLPFNYSSDFQRICWVCERRAAAAYRFRLSVNLSASLHSLFAQMQLSTRSYRLTADQLKGLKKPSGIVRSACEWQHELCSVRARSALLQTEVLMVASVPPASCNTQTTSAPTEEEYLLPDEAPPPAPAPTPTTPTRRKNKLAEALCEPEIFMESVVLEDDEQDPIDIKHEEPAFEEITIDDTPMLDTSPILDTAPTQQSLDNANKETSFLLHPIVENHGLVTVPTLGAQIIEGKLVSVDKTNIIIQTPRIAIHDGKNFNLVSDPNTVTEYLKSINSRKLAEVSIVSNNISVQAMETNIQITNQMPNLRLQPEALRNLQLHLNVTPNMQLQSNVTSNMQLQSNVTNNLQLEIRPAAPKVVSENSDIRTLMSGQPYTNNNIMTHSIVIDDEESDDVGKRQSDGDNGKRKRDRDKNVEEPPSKQRETDWEDKIPMDVISYMDATDPNANELLNPDPPLGIITDVHTLTDTPNQLTNTPNKRTYTPKRTNVPTKVFQNRTNVPTTNVSKTRANVPLIKLLPKSTNISKTVPKVLSKVNEPQMLFSPVISSVMGGSCGEATRANSEVTVQGSDSVTVRGTASGTQGSNKNAVTSTNGMAPVHINVFNTSSKSKSKTILQGGNEVIDLC